MSFRKKCPRKTSQTPARLKGRPLHWEGKDRGVERKEGKRRKYRSVVPNWLLQWGQWRRARNFHLGTAAQEVWGTIFHQRGPEAKPGRCIEAEAVCRHCLEFKPHFSSQIKSALDLFKLKSTFKSQIKSAFDLFTFDLRNDQNSKLWD